MKYIGKYGAYFEVVDGKLYDSPALVFEGRVEPDPESYGEVTAPQVMGETKAREFIEVINNVFGTKFKLEDFDGR